MNYDELSFVNQQLAGMLKSGVPLEGALRELSATMQRGALRDELTALEADLAKGTPLADALAKRKLPEFYVRMVQVGAKSGDLPGVLLLLADYYARANALWTRLKGLMVYPLLVLLVSFAVSLLIAFLLTSVLSALLGDMPIWHLEKLKWTTGAFGPWQLVWTPVAALGLILMTALVTVAIPNVRRSMRRRIPAFRDAAFAQFAGAMALMLQSGNTLKDALAMMRHVEGDSPIGREIARWQVSLAEGRGKLSDLTSSAKEFPPMFLWLVGQGGEDAAKGFAKAASVYHERAMHGADIVLSSALPVAVIGLGITIIAQVAPTFRVLQDLGWMFD